MRATLGIVPAGIEFECPHCHRVTRVPVTLAGKQGRCAGCRKVLEVPATGASPGRTPDPDDGLLEVLDAKRASDRLAAARRASDRVVPGARPSDRGEVEAPEPSSADSEPQDEGTTTKLPPPAPYIPRLSWGAWARKVPPRVWLALPLSVVFPALGIAVGVFALKPARQAGAGERLAWTGIGIGSTIMALNLVLVLWKVSQR